VLWGFIAAAAFIGVKGLTEGLPKAPDYGPVYCDGEVMRSTTPASCLMRDSRIRCDHSRWWLTKRQIWRRVLVSQRTEAAVP
jgi:hypothetical protein